MPTPRRIWYSGILLLVLIASGAAGQRATVNCTGTASECALAEYARRAGLLGFSGVILVADSGTLRLHEGFGWADPVRHLRNDTTTPFYIASLAKQFTAAAVLRLVDDGRLQVTDSLGRFFPGAPPDKRGITIRQLLTHTSGFGRVGWDDIAGDWQVMTRDEAVQEILRSPLAHHPGAVFAYQNSNYILLAAIVERIAQQPFERFLRDRVVPRSVHAAFSQVASARLSRPVAWSIDDPANTFTFGDRPDSWLRVGAGDVVTTAADLYRWVEAIQHGAVLSARGVEQLIALQRPFQPGFGYGYGWFVRTDSGGATTVAFHGGDFKAYHAEVRWYPHRNRVLVATTNRSFRGQSVTEPLLNGAVEVMSGRPDPLPPVRPIEAGELNRCLGTFQSSDGVQVSLTAENHVLQLEPEGQGAIDWFVAQDTVDQRLREGLGRRTDSLVLTLKRIGGSAYRRVLAPELTPSEFAAEWEALTGRGGRLKSYQILGGLRTGDHKAETQIVVRITFAQDSLLMGFTWRAGALVATSPRRDGVIQPMVFAGEGAGRFVSYDWGSGDVQSLVCAPTATGIRLLAHNSLGDLVLTKTGR